MPPRHVLYSVSSLLEGTNMVIYDRCGAYVCRNLGFIRKCDFSMCSQAFWVCVHSWSDILKIGVFGCVRFQARGPSSVYPVGALNTFTKNTFFWNTPFVVPVHVWFVFWLCFGVKKQGEMWTGHAPARRIRVSRNSCVLTKTCSAAQAHHLSHFVHKIALSVLGCFL